MTFSILDILWIFFILFAFLPVVQRRMLEYKRLNLIRKIEKKRKSRVIVLIHRQEVVAFLGIPFTGFISIEDSESILRAIRFTPSETPIDFIVHTPGGLVLASEQIASALSRHKGHVTVFVPHYAMSGGTLLALAGDEIVMDENAVLGSLDPQLAEYPAISILNAVKQKPLEKINDKTLILADVAEKAMNQVSNSVSSILIQNGMNSEKAKKISQTLTSGRWTHDYPIDYDKAKAIGLAVKIGLPAEIYELMDLYPQSGRREPSVQYIPVPYLPRPRPSKKTKN